MSIKFGEPASNIVVGVSIVAIVGCATFCNMVSNALNLANFRLGSIDQKLDSIDKDNKTRDAMLSSHDYALRSRGFIK